MPLGLAERADYKSIMVLLEADDLLLFYCNGITQAENPEGNDYGVTGLDRM